MKSEAQNILRRYVPDGLREAILLEYALLLPKCAGLIEQYRVDLPYLTGWEYVTLPTLRGKLEKGEINNQALAKIIMDLSSVTEAEWKEHGFPILAEYDGQCTYVGSDKVLSGFQYNETNLAVFTPSGLLYVDDSTSIGDGEAYSMERFEPYESFITSGYQNAVYDVTPLSDAKLTLVNRRWDARIACEFVSRCVQQPTASFVILLKASTEWCQI